MVIGHRPNNTHTKQLSFRETHGGGLSPFQESTFVGTGRPLCRSLGCGHALIHWSAQVPLMSSRSNRSVDSLLGAMQSIATFWMCAASSVRWLDVFALLCDSQQMRAPTRRTPVSRASIHCMARVRVLVTSLRRDRVRARALRWP